MYCEKLKESEKKILLFISKHPGCTRRDIIEGTGYSYSTVRRVTNKMMLMGWIRGKLTRMWRYWIKRERRIVVTSFQFTKDVARIKRDDQYAEGIRHERLVEVVVEVDKPVFIPIEPEYVLAVFLDYSAWAFSIGTMRGRRAHPDKIDWPARDFWLPELVKKEQRRIKIAMKRTLPDAKIHVGSTDILPSYFEDGEYYVSIIYTDYNYEKNSFRAEKIFFDALEKQVECKFARELIGWIIDVDNANFRWGTPLYFKKKYGVEG